jgi:hypothetical protein
MAKQDVLDAINATIAPNNIKGITAESLNNVLTMMAENAGEGGGGDGALRVIVPELVMLGPEFIPIGEFSPTSWEEVKSNFEQATGVDLSEYDAAVKASFEHNANIAQQILAKAKVGEGVSVVLDQTPYMPTTLSIQFQMMPELAAQYEDFAVCVVQPAALAMEYVKPTPEVEGIIGEQLFCALNPLAPPTLPEYSMLYPSNMDIVLNLDGSLTFTPIEEEQPSSGSGVVTFYAAIGEELPNEYKEKNAEAYSAFESGSLVTLQLYIAGGIRSTMTPITTSKEPNAITLGILQEGDNGFTIAPYVINADGSANLLQ